MKSRVRYVREISISKSFKLSHNIIFFVILFSSQNSQLLITDVFFFSDGLVESLLSHMNGFIGKLHLLATHKLGALTEVLSLFKLCLSLLDLSSLFMYLCMWAHNFQPTWCLFSTFYILEHSMIWFLLFKFINIRMTLL